MFILDEEDGSFIYYSPDFADRQEKEANAVTREMFEGDPGALKVGNRTYEAAYENMQFSGRPVKAIVLTPSISSNIYVISSVIIAVCFILVVAGGMILWVHWIQDYKKKHVLTERQEKR